MKAFLRGLSFFYGAQFVLSALGLLAFLAMGGGSVLSQVHPSLGEEQFLLIACLAVCPQLGAGITLIYFGMSLDMRAKCAVATRKALEYLREI